MTVAAMLAMIVIEFGGRGLAVVGVERMTEFLLMTCVIAVRHAVHEDIGCGFQTHEEQGKNHVMAYERTHSSLA